MSEAYEPTKLELARWRFDGWLHKQKTNLPMKLAWLLPRTVAMWAFIRLAAHATSGKWGNETPDSVGIMTALDRWDKPQ